MEFLKLSYLCYPTVVYTLLVSFSLLNYGWFMNARCKGGKCPSNDESEPQAISRSKAGITRKEQTAPVIIQAARLVQRIGKAHLFINVSEHAASFAHAVFGGSSRTEEQVKMDSNSVRYFEEYVHLYPVKSPTRMSTGNVFSCNARVYKAPNNIVCVCNGTYCDTIQPLPSNLPLGTAALYVSSQAGKRFSYQTLKTYDAERENDNAVVITVDSSVKRQSILGFGGAFTDAAGINIASISSGAQWQLIQSYFGQHGLEYTIGRIPMASCDFSTREYSYDDVAGDFNLTHFALAHEDLQYKIPYIKAAMRASASPIRLFGSPWSAPGWMKTTGRMKGYGTLIGSAGDKYHKAWANYFVRFVQEYAANNVTIWGLTVENEPSAGFETGYTFQAMGFTPETERDFIKTDLGPALSAHKLSNLKLMILDDQRFFIPQWVDTILSDQSAAKYVSGIAIHWYADLYSSVDSLDYAHNRYPKYFILSTEACTGALPYEVRGPVLGDWKRAERYAHDIMEDLNHWASGWIDWNLALDLKGGPNWVNNIVDSPIIVNKTADEFYKQPMFYALGHFSKFVRPNSVWIQSSVSVADGEDAEVQLEVATFIRPDKKRVSILLNRSDESKKVALKEKGTSHQFQFSMDARSIATIVWAV